MIHLNLHIFVVRNNEGYRSLFRYTCRKIRDVEKTNSWRSEDGGVQKALKFIAILEADPNDDKFSRVKSAAD